MRLFFTISLLASTLVLTGCDPGSDSTSASDSKAAVELQLNWVPEPQFGGIYQAEIDGMFKQEGLSVEIIAGSDGVSSPQMVAAGRVDFGIVGGSQILQLNAQGGTLVALFAVYQHGPHGIMIPADSSYTDVAELWKDPEAVVGIDTSLAFFKSINEAHRVPNGAKFVAYNAPAFRAGRQAASQCFITAEPVSLELDGFPTRILPNEDRAYDPYDTVLVTRRAFLEAHPETCRAMVSAFESGWKSYLNDPSSANRRMSALNPAMSELAMTLSAKAQEPLILDSTTKEHGLGYMDDARWSAMGEALVRLGLLESAPEPSSVFVWFGGKDQKETSNGK